MKNFYHRTWAEIDLDVLKKNIEVIQGFSGDKEIIAIVKANAYGHGDAAIAKALNGCGVKHFAVSNLWEAQNLSSANVEGDILLFGYCDIPLVIENADRNYIFTVGSVDYAEELSAAAVAAGKVVPVHIKFDTGMSRVGITTGEEADRILALPGLDCKAGYTHFAVADSLEQTDEEFTKLQYKRLADICKPRKLPMHCQNSGGILFHKDFEADLVRAGIVMYGHRPNIEYPLPEGIKSIFSLRSVISQIKTIQPGETVSYGRTFTAEKPTRLALIPCGYADGFNRKLSGQWNVIVCGKPAPVCGRICMDQTMIDITDIPEAKIGDVVTVYSDETSGGSSIDHAAELAGTISYELLCCIGTRVPRLYIENGEEKDLLRYL